MLRPSAALSLLVLALPAPAVRAAEAPAAVPPAAESAPAVPAGPVLTLRHALQATLEQSPALRISAQGIEQRSGVAEQASGAVDWNALAAASVGKDRTPVPGLPGTELVDDSSTVAYSAGVAKQFRNGVVIRPTASVAVQDGHSSPLPSTGVSQLNFQVEVPLLRGLGADSTGAAEAAARGDIEVARLLYEHALAAQAYATALSYWSSRAADETLVMQREVEKASGRLVESTKVLVDTRIFPPAFLLQAEANLRDKRTSRIDAELEARNSRYALGQALGLAPEAIAATPAATDDFPALTPADITIDAARQGALVQRALADRADLRASRASLVPLNILARQAQLDLKPRLDLTLSAGYKGLNLGNDVLAPLTSRLTGANGLVGLSLAWPIQNTYQRGLLRERRGDVQVAGAQADQLAQQIAAEVLVAVERVRLRADAVRSAQETVDIARKALKAQYDQLKAGEGTLLDVISLENLFSGARLRDINARATYAIAIAQLRYALGDVFERTSGTAFTPADLATLPTFPAESPAR